MYQENPKTRTQDWLFPTELVTLLEDRNWICKLCLNDLFPFNHTENEKEFIASIDDTDPISSLLNLRIIFEPFETEEISQFSPLYDVDIDLHYYNSTYSLSNTECTYYDRKSLNDDVSVYPRTCIPDDKRFSLCHLNTRSIKQNLKSLEVYMEDLCAKFSIIGISETWMNDDICNLYSIPDYHLVERHRTTRSGGGVGIYFQWNTFQYTIGSFALWWLLWECHCWNVIDKCVFGTNRSIIICVLYRPPNTDTRLFNEYCQKWK